MGCPRKRADMASQIAEFFCGVVSLKIVASVLLSLVDQQPHWGIPSIADPCSEGIATPQYILNWFARQNY